MTRGDGATSFDAASLSIFAEDRAFWRAWGSWLNGFHWDHFATTTFKRQPSPERAMWELRTWLRRLAQRAQRQVDGFLALERGGLGRLHGHCLLVGTSDLNTVAVAKAWRPGRAEAVRYDAARGAAWYVTKDIANRIIDYHYPRNVGVSTADAA